MMNFKNVLCTGAAGFVGSAFVRHAVDAHPEWKIRVLDKMTYAANRANLANVLDQIDFMVGDCCNEFDAVRAMADIDAVVHFAAESHVDRSLVDPLAFAETNIRGTLMMLAAAKQAGVRRFVQVSTDECYGDTSGSDRLSVEGDPLQPRSPYASSKAAAEHFARCYYTSFGLDVVITRGANTYGAFQFPEKIIPLFVTRALLNKTLPLYGDGSAVRDYLHVMDHVRGIDMALHLGVAGEAYNLGAGLSISAKEIGERILNHLKKPYLLVNVPDRLGHDYRYAMSSEKAESELGWQPLWDFQAGLRDTIEWYAAHRYWWQQTVDSQAAFA